MASRTPARTGTALRQLFVLAAALALWITAWLSLTVAAAVAGGSPRDGPLQLIDPASIVRNLRGAHGLPLWRLVGAGSRTQPAMFWAAMIASVLAAAGVVAGVRHASARITRSGRGLRSSSRWARRLDLRGLHVWRHSRGRLVIGRAGARLLSTEGETSVLVVGPTRSGKTTCLVVPNLLEWDGPAIVTSTKSELLTITAARRQRIGPVHVYDPTGELGSQFRSVTWSPLAGCHVLDRAWSVASWLCAGLQQGSSRGDNDWIHWAESGKLLIAPLLYAAARTRLTLVDVHAWIQAFDVASPLAVLEDIIEDDPEHFEEPARAMTMLASVDQRPERERGTVFSTVMRIFSALNEHAVARSAVTSRFDAHAFLERSGTLYLCTPRLAPERIAGLFVGILMTAVTEAYAVADRSPRGRLPRELGLFLDELVNVVPIEELPSVASQGAGRGVVCMSIVQDVSQLRGRYGADRTHSILNNHPCKVVLPGVTDPETIDLMSRLVGRSQYTDVQVNRGAVGRVSRSYSLRQDSLASPDALRQLTESSAVVVYRGRPPVVVRLVPWYRRRRLRVMAAQRFFGAAEYVGPAAQPRTVAHTMRAALSGVVRRTGRR